MAIKTCLLMLINKFEASNIYFMGSETSTSLRCSLLNEIIILFAKTKVY